eukprot:m51a1_g7108 hypothetical protein (494) ;mRNA; f:64959-67144
MADMWKLKITSERRVELLDRLVEHAKMQLDKGAREMLNERETMLYLTAATPEEYMRGIKDLITKMAAAAAALAAAHSPMALQQQQQQQAQRAAMAQQQQQQQIQQQLQQLQQQQRTAAPSQQQQQQQVQAQLQMQLQQQQQAQQAQQAGQQLRVDPYAQLSAMQRRMMGPGGTVLPTPVQTQYSAVSRDSHALATTLGAVVRSPQLVGAQRPATPTAATPTAVVVCTPATPLEPSTPVTMRGEAVPPSVDPRILQLIAENRGRLGLAGLRELEARVRASAHDASIVRTLIAILEGAPESLTQVKYEHMLVLIRTVVGPLAKHALEVISSAVSNILAQFQNIPESAMALVPQPQQPQQPQPQQQQQQVAVAVAPPENAYQHMLPTQQQAAMSAMAAAMQQQQQSAAISALMSSVSQTLQLQKQQQQQRQEAAEAKQQQQQQQQHQEGSAGAAGAQTCTEVAANNNSAATPSAAGPAGSGGAAGGAGGAGGAPPS